MSIPSTHHAVFRRRQRGVGALAVSSLLLLVASIMLLYLNRSVIFEQRTSANQMRATSAQELAEAGLEWAIGMFNTQQAIGSDCKAIPNPNPNTDSSFRSHYIRFPTNSSGLPVTATKSEMFNETRNIYPNIQPYCAVGANAGSLTCSCPSDTSPQASLSQAHFVVRFEPEQDTPDLSDPSGTKFHWETVRITSIGCIGATDGACVPPTASPDTPSDKRVAINSRNADASAIASVAIKLRPTVPGGPFAALTCGGSCGRNGNFSIVNTSVAANGLIAISGDQINGANRNIATIPGLPVENALITNDLSLKTLAGNDSNCNNSAVFQSYFGSTLDQYANAPNTKIIACDKCEDDVQQAYKDGIRSFYFPNGFHFNKTTSLGTLAEPVVLVTPSHFRINSDDFTVNGLIFSNSMDADAIGSGKSNINGAIITCKNFESTGTGTLSYSAQVIANIGRSTGNLVKIPGSWRDWSF
ncbi:MAG: hypothetical protein IPG98_07390 [Burkholderiales bacterium]|nr:hypothetical protein [Burkholderiales bacterium]MBK8665863.1 hypothetical protein [Burkholderiales bacterium]